MPDRSNGWSLPLPPRSSSRSSRPSAGNGSLVRSEPWGGAPAGKGGGEMRSRSRVVVWAAVVAMPLALVLAPSAGADAPPLPNSMAAIGDSISQAFDVCCWYGDHPGKSWSTGSDGDSILSHYERILAANPNIAGNEHNDSVSGAKMADADGQAASAVSQQVEYVTILMG